MVKDTEGSDLKPESLGHHTEGGRNIVPGNRGHGGNDIFFAAVQMSRMPMILTDPRQPDNPIIFANRAFEKLTGYEPAEIIGHNCRFLQGPDTDREVVGRIRQGIAQRADIYEDVYNYRKDGSGFWNALYISPVFDADGSLVYFFASQLDVTRRHEAEAVVQQAQRLETLGSMASGVAHEFNNLMTVALGSLAQLERSITDRRDLQRLERARWAAQQAGRLTQQMLSFARRQFHDNHSVDINQLLGNFDDILRQMAGAKVRFSLALMPGPLFAELDVGQMEMALLNLVRNASDAMPQGGTLAISTHAAEGLDDTATVEVAVRDSGTGMSPEVVRRAIEPFFTTKPKGSGTGLGLSMVNGFAAQSGGHMVIESVPREGTTIRLVFPRHRPAEQGPPDEARPPAA